MAATTGELVLPGEGVGALLLVGPGSSLAPGEELILGEGLATFDED
jgi:hypothetical protein